MGIPREAATKTRYKHFLALEIKLEDYMLLRSLMHLRLRYEAFQIHSAFSWPHKTLMEQHGCFLIARSWIFSFLA